MYDRRYSGIPGGESAKERKMMVRFKCGNEERENRYSGGERRCNKEIWKRRERDRKIKGRGIEIKMLLFGIVIFIFNCNRNLKS
jgi:hypothetical protein